MIKTNKSRLVALSACVVAAASLCLVAGAADKRPTRRKKRSRRPDVSLKIGQMAPDFELYMLEQALAMKDKSAPKPTSRPTTQPADGKVRLSSFRGKRPVYLIFASYT